MKKFLFLFGFVFLFSQFSDATLICFGSMCVDIPTVPPGTPPVPTPLPTAPPTTPPVAFQVKSVSPADNAVNVLRHPQISITFSKNLASGKVTLFPADRMDQLVPLTTTVSGTRLVATLNAELRSNTTYIINALSVRGTDGTSFTAAFSSEFTTEYADDPPPTSGAGKKWHPGHYVSGDKFNAVNLKHLDELDGVPAIKGYLQGVHWGYIETAENVYDFDLLDQALAECKKRNLRLVIRIQDKTFAGNLDSQVLNRLQPYLPKYLHTKYDGILEEGDNKGVVAKLWLAPVMDRFIALQKAIAKRYDSDPYFEGIRTGETSIPKGPDYTHEKYYTELKRLAAAMSTTYLKSNVWFGTNFGGDRERLRDLMAYLKLKQIGAGGPDLLPAPHAPTWGDWITRGFRWAPDSSLAAHGTWVTGGTDYRGVIPIFHEVQGPEMGGKEGSWTPEQFWNHAKNISGDQHIAWVRKEFTYEAPKYPSPDIYWSSDIFPWLTNVGKPLNTECPEAYSSCNRQ